MARIQQIKHPDGDVIYPISHTNAIIDDSGNRLENVLQDLKQNSSIWNIELGSGVALNRPDDAVDIVLGSVVHIGTDGPVLIGSDVYIESGFDSRYISGSGGGGLWKVENNLLISQDSNRNIQLGTELMIGTSGFVTIDGTILGIQVYNDSNQPAILIGTNVKIGTSNESIDISQKSIQVNDAFGNQSIFIGSDVYIDNEFDTRNYFDVNANLHPACIPTDSSLKKSSKLAVNIEPQSNGNIKIGDTLFMPATPSGDPMHYAYETAGAEYNATTDFIVKNAPWKDMVDTIEDKAKWGFDVVDASQVKQMTIKGTIYNYVQTTRQSPQGTTEPRYYLVGQASDGTWVEDETKVLHLPGHWYLNGLGDITNKEIAVIYENYNLVKELPIVRSVQIAKIRTFFPLKASWYNQYNSSELQGFMFANVIEVVFILKDIPLYNTSYPEDRAPSIHDARGFDNNIVAKYLPQHRILKTNETTYKNSTKLRVVPIVNIKTSLLLNDIIQLSKNSILYIINNAAPTTPITITLHADRYAQLSEDADIVAALETKNAALEGTGGSISLVSA